MQHISLVVATYLSHGCSSFYSFSNISLAWPNLLPWDPSKMHFETSVLMSFIWTWHTSQRWSICPVIEHWSCEKFIDELYSTRHNFNQRAYLLSCGILYIYIYMPAVNYQIRMGITFYLWLQLLLVSSVSHKIAFQFTSYIELDHCQVNGSNIMSEYILGLGRADLDANWAKYDKNPRTVVT